MHKGLTDLRKLRHVVGVAKAGSFTSASHTLAITQSALTKSVAEVEQIVGIRLFERLPRGVQLTAAGEAFVPRAERILNEAADLMTEVNRLQSLATGHLRIGVTPAAAIRFLEHTVSAFAKVYPGVSIEVSEGTTETMANALLAGQLDVVVGSAGFLQPWTELQIETIAELNTYFICRKDHPLARVDDPSAADLLRYPVVMPAADLTTDAHLNKAYSAAGLTPMPARYVCNHFPLVKRLVSSTDAISPVISLAPPSDRVHQEFQVFAGIIHFKPPVLAIARVRGRAHSPATRAFTEIFKNFLQDTH